MAEWWTCWLLLNKSVTPKRQFHRDSSIVSLVEQWTLKCIILFCQRVHSRITGINLIWLYSMTLVSFPCRSSVEEYDEHEDAKRTPCNEIVSTLLHLLSPTTEISWREGQHLPACWWWHHLSSVIMWGICHCPSLCYYVWLHKEAGLVGSLVMTCGHSMLNVYIVLIMNSKTTHTNLSRSILHELLSLTQ